MEPPDRLRPGAPPVPNPWKTLTNESVYESPWIEVSHRKVINPNGGESLYGLVHFKNLAIGIIPVDAEDHTYLVGQYRYATDEYSWEIPAGGGDRSDDPEATARRELQEETGFTAATLELILEPRISNSVTDELGYLYVARDLTSGAANPDDTEDLALWRLPVDEAIAMVLSGEIHDSLSVMGLLRLHAQRTSRPSSP